MIEVSRIRSSSATGSVHCAFIFIPSHASRPTIMSPTRLIMPMGTADVLYVALRVSRISDTGRILTVLMTRWAVSRRKIEKA